MLYHFTVCLPKQQQHTASFNRKNEDNFIYKHLCTYTHTQQSEYVATSEGEGERVQHFLAIIQNFLQSEHENRWEFFVFTRKIISNFPRRL